MFNRKSNNKSKKTTTKNHNDFRMEALEPRLLQQVADLSARQREKANFLSLRSPCMVAIGGFRLDFIL